VTIIGKNLLDHYIGIDSNSAFQPEVISPEEIRDLKWYKALKFLKR
jgi:hypothetical protein